jgi:quercetin dioxygenase-like cupin family protein
MKVIRLHQTAAEDHRDAVRDAMDGRTVVRCGVAEFAPHSYAHEGEQHKHEHPEVFIVLNGEITAAVEGQPDQIARAGDWVLIDADQEHHMTNHTHLPCTCMYLILKA